MQARWLWLQHTQSLLPWLPILGTVDASAIAFFRASTRWLLGDGASIHFWLAPSLDGQTINELAP
jgi:hypothetical protein